MNISREARDEINVLYRCPTVYNNVPNYYKMIIN